MLIDTFTPPTNHLRLIIYSQVLGPISVAFKASDVKIFNIPEDYNISHTIILGVRLKQPLQIIKKKIHKNSIYFAQLRHLQGNSFMIKSYHTKDTYHHHSRQPITTTVNFQTTFYNCSSTNYF